MVQTIEFRTADLNEVKKAYAREHFRDFCFWTLGYRDLNSIHNRLCSFLEEKWKYKIILMPRYTFKSCIATVGYSLWRLARNPNERILIYSDAATKAEGFLTSITNHITDKVAGSSFRKTFGPWETNDKSLAWNRSQIVIKPRIEGHKEPSVDTGGIETSKIGCHYDLIIFDDIVSDVNVTTKAQMDKVSDCYKKSLSLLKPGGDVVIVGTRWHFGDLYGRLIAENRESGLFRTFIEKAFTGDDYFFANIGENSLTKDRLQLLRSQQGTRVFSCLYQNTPTDDETAIFKEKDFSFKEVSSIDLYLTATLDPAGEGEDFTAITIVGTDHQMNMYLLEIVNEHLKPSQIIDKILTLNYKYKFKMLGIETNFFRGTLKQELDTRRFKEHQDNPKNFPLFGIHEFLASSKRGEGKYQRICALQPYHERGAIKFPGTCFELLKGAFSELSFQMVQFPNAPHDDILDSLAYHLPLIRKGGLVKTKEIPHNCPADLERQAYEQELKSMRMRPRRYRERIPGLTFS